MSFTYSRSLTIDHTKCGSSVSSNFPVLVSASDTTLKDVAHGGHVQSSTGADILFFADNAAATQYPSEIDFYDNVNGILTAWVQVPTVSNVSNTVFYFFYGNAVPPARTTNPWDSNYVGVWHFANGTSLSVTDSTGHNTSTNNSATATAGQIDGAANIAGGTQYIDSGSQIGSMAPGDGTFSIWANHTHAFNSGISDCLADAMVGGNEFQVLHFTDNHIYAGFVTSGTGHRVVLVASSSNWPTATWTHYCLTWGSGGTAILYINGVSAGSQGGIVVSNPAATVRFGYYYTGPVSYTGKLDEARFSKVVRGPDWITTEFNNQNAPGNIGSAGFLTWSSETVMAVAVEDHISVGTIFGAQTPTGHVGGF